MLRLASIVYKMGSIPHEAPPKDSYQHLFDYGNLMESIEMLLEDNSNCNLFLYKEVESLDVASCPVQFDVYHALLVPPGEHPPKWLDTQNGGEEYVSFKELSLEWKNVGDLKDDLLETWSKTILGGRVFVLKSKSRRWRNIDDEKKALFMKVSRFVGFTSSLFVDTYSCYFAVILALHVGLSPRVFPSLPIHRNDQIHLLHWWRGNRY